MREATELWVLAMYGWFSDPRGEGMRRDYFKSLLYSRGIAAWLGTSRVGDRTMRQVMQ